MSLEALADELGAVESFLAPHKHKMARAELLRKALRAAFADAAADSEHIITGTEYAVFVGPCGNISVIDVEELAKRIGLAQYAKVATPSLKSIEEHCGPQVLAAVVATKQAGPRPLTLSALPKPVAAAKPKRTKAA